MWKYSNDTEITVWFHFVSMHSAGIFQCSEKIKSFYKEVSLLLKLIFLKFTDYFKLAYGFSFLCRASSVLYYGQKMCDKIKIKIHKALISSNTWIFGKVSSFAQEAPAVASVPSRRSLHDIIEDFWERVPFGVDVWGGNWEIHWFFSFLVGENNMVSLTPALKLSEA